MDRPVPPSLGFLLFDAARLLRRRFEQESRDIPMTSAQMEIVQPMTLSRHIDRMETGGLVERRPDPKDRRARRLHTTETARALVEPMRAHALAVYDEAQAGLAPEARDALVAGLAAIIANLSAASAGDDEEPERRRAAGA
jgi:MarR family transcriptional regulator for hemolysin